VDAADAGFTLVTVRTAHAAATAPNTAERPRATFNTLSEFGMFASTPRTTAITETTPAITSRLFLAPMMFLDCDSTRVNIAMSNDIALVAHINFPVSIIDNNATEPANTPITTAILISGLAFIVFISPENFVMRVAMIANAAIAPTAFTILPSSIPAISFIAPANIRTPADIASIPLPSLSLLPPPGSLEIPIRTPYNMVISPNVIIPFAISPLSILAICLIAVAIRIKLAEIASIPLPATCAFCPAKRVASITPERTIMTAVKPPNPFRISSGFIFASFLIDRTAKYKEAEIAISDLAPELDLNFVAVYSMNAFIPAKAPIRPRIVSTALSISPSAFERLFNA